MPRAVLLFTGSLDSQLAARILQLQRIDLRGLFVRTPWSCGDRQPEAHAAKLGLPLTCVNSAPEFCEPLTLAAARGLKPTQFCIDCHHYLARAARAYQQECGADFVATGDVLGQRAANQKRRDFDRLAHHAGLADRLVWPLSAKHLAPTLPEREGWLDRERLQGFCGRGRARLKALGRELGLDVADRGPSGCPLGQTGDFGDRVLSHVTGGGARQHAEFELLRCGLLLRQGETRLHVGRRQAENETMERLWQAGGTSANWLLKPADTPGPTILLVGAASAGALDLAISTLMRYAKAPTNRPFAMLAVDRAGTTRRIERGDAL